MKTIYLECAMGAAGDMLTAALLELLPDQQAFLEKMNALGLPGVTVRAQEVLRCGIRGTGVRVLVDGAEEESHDVHDAHHHDDHDHHHHHHDHHDDDHHHHDHHHHHTHAHTTLQEIEQMIGTLPLSEQVRTDALAVYRLLAAAESAAHGKPVEQIHFHEVGTLDAAADIIGVCLLVELLSAQYGGLEIMASPVHMGSGHVRCAHGILPVPAPATAFLLREIPAYSGQIHGELCTPTGAALLKHFVRVFGEMPPMRVERIGYGMGKKEFEQLNCVRAFLGETEAAPWHRETLTELNCNLDDMTGEDIAYACRVLRRHGARDVFTTAVFMKKNRPGVLLTVLCTAAQQEEMLCLIFRHTTTIGIRLHCCERLCLVRRQEQRTLHGLRVRVKASGEGVYARQKPEHDDLEAIADAQGGSLYEVRRQLEAADKA